MGEIVDKLLETTQNFLQYRLAKELGDLLVFIGGLVGDISIVFIALGFFLLIFRNTKVLRNSFLVYFIALLVEILGLSLNK